MHNRPASSLCVSSTRVDAPLTSSVVSGCTSSPPRARGCTYPILLNAELGSVSSARAWMHRTTIARIIIRFGLLRARGCTEWGEVTSLGLLVSSAHAWMHPSSSSLSSSPSCLLHARVDAPKMTTSPCVWAASPPRARGCTAPRLVTTVGRVSSTRTWMHPITGETVAPPTGPLHTRVDAPIHDAASPYGNVSPLCAWMHRSLPPIERVSSSCMRGCTRGRVR